MNCPHGTIATECPVCRSSVPPTPTPPLDPMSKNALVMIGVTLGHSIVRAVDAFADLCEAGTTFLDNLNAAVDDDAKEPIQ